eukprot:CAMPEP_0174874016 /NCGR_PEP_ID=MMETSP1114-20130205/75951_1 /TAXON_ID=312471 /ORGANISM="Neobodo designis, Strain CCAP 1951/1" /LENGTH=545 /DNA_ID=CAMNT_0016109341 /DNA_START=73 /DNA_END=1710 /DNA_ORIENTATION=-
MRSSRQARSPPGSARSGNAGSGRAAASPSAASPNGNSAAATPVCVECRKPFRFDCSEWVRVKPAAASEFTLDVTDRDSMELLAQVRDAPAPAPLAAHGAPELCPIDTAPTVVFGTRTNGTPPAREIEAGEWVKLTPEQCYAHCLMLGDAMGEDFPLCAPCWGHLLRRKQRELSQLRAATDDVVETIRGLDGDGMALTLPAPDADALRRAVAADADDAAARAEEDEIRAAEAELAALVAEGAALDAELEALEKREDAVAGAVQDRLAAQWLAVEDRDRVAEERSRLDAEAARMETLVAFDALFPIDIDAAVPTLCGLRLGRLPSSQPAPPETNAACGLLLTAASILRRRHEGKLRCPNVRSLVLAGEASQIEVVSGKSTGGKVEKVDFHIKTSFFSWRTFGPAWVAFATLCEALVRALRSKLEEKASEAAADAVATTEDRGAGSDAAATRETALKLLDEGKQLPRVDGDKVGGFSVRYGDAPDHTWTSGVREVLRMVKWCFRADALVVFGLPPAVVPAKPLDAAHSQNDAAAPMAGERNQSAYGEQ